jgi:hypothetical protein
MDLLLDTSQSHVDRAYQIILWEGEGEEGQTSAIQRQRDYPSQSPAGKLSQHIYRSPGISIYPGLSPSTHKNYAGPQSSRGVKRTTCANTEQNPTRNSGSTARTTCGVRPINYAQAHFEPPVRYSASTWLFVEELHTFKYKTKNKCPMQIQA